MEQWFGNYNIDTCDMAYCSALIHRVPSANTNSTDLYVAANNNKDLPN
jgi:hypothetical protein